MARLNLRFRLYSIHAHLATGNPNYDNLLQTLADLSNTVHEEDKHYIAVGSAKLIGRRLSLIFYSGDKDKSVLFYDLIQKAEITSLNAPGTFPARKTHVMIDPIERLAVIEAGRGRIGADEIERFIEDYARKKEEYKTLELSLSPVAAKEFVEEIDLLERIQSATVSIARPNPDWTDNYNALTQLADESQGKVIDTTVRAKRGASISKEKGIIASLKAWLVDKKSSVSSAKIKGERASKAGLTLLNLNDYVESVTIAVDIKTETGQPVDSIVEQRLNTYLDEKGKESAQSAGPIREG